MPVHNYYGLGLMSGSSLDGLDVALVHFEIEDGRIFDWSLKGSQEYSFPKDLQSKLAEASKMDAKSFCDLDQELGMYFGTCIKKFEKECGIEIDFIASHGHTIFHFPEKGYSKQIGNPAALRASIDAMVISDFRSMDMAYGGEGAPLAPVVEHFLYPGYDFYLNLGGIANLSFHEKENIKAYDVCPANQILNALAKTIGQDYDKDGLKARSGSSSDALRQKLILDPYLNREAPKSMDNSYIQNFYFPLLKDSSIEVQDKLYTCTHFIAEQISIQIKELMKNEKPKAALNCLVSGGGAFNDYLMETIALKSQDLKFVLPSMENIKFKEAILMALLGLLRILEKPNSFASVTGASKDTINGSIYY